MQYAVGNIPGAVPHTSTYALTNATLRYAVALASKGVKNAIASHSELLGGVNLVGSNVCHPAVAESLGLPYMEPNRALTEV